jgi:hypothetical protein
VSRKTVAASLRRQGLAGISPREALRPGTTVVDLDSPVPKDLVKRRFDTGALDVDQRYHLSADRAGLAVSVLSATAAHDG